MSSKKRVVLSDEPFAIRAYATRQRRRRAKWRAAIRHSRCRERWKIEELHTEEGRLDEVFRNITQSETSQKDSP